MASTELDRFRADVVLIKQHAERRDLDSFAPYWDDPLKFMAVECDFRPCAKQIDVIDAFIAGKRTVVRGCHGAGKDAVLSALAMFAAYVRGMLVLAMSATERQLLNQFWREIGNRFTKSLPGQLYTSDLRINGQKRIIALTAGAGSVSHLTGWHDPHGVFIAMSESQAESVGDDAFDAAESNAIDELSKIVVVGNPLQSGTRFHAVHSRPTWQQIRISAFEHPNIIENRMVVLGGPAPTWPEEMRAEYGADSPFYLSRVLAEFPAEGSVDALIKRSWMERAFQHHDAGDLAESYAWKPLVLGLDVSRFGSNQTALAVTRGGSIEALHTWRGLDLVATTDRLLEHATALTVPRRDFDTRQIVVTRPKIVVDDTGVGGGVTDIARKRGWSIVAYNGGGRATDVKKFLNARANVAWHFRTLLEQDKVALPRSARLLEEATALTYQLTSKGLIQLTSKDDLAKTLSGSTDLVDAITMALSQSLPMRGAYATLRHVVM